MTTDLTSRDSLASAGFSASEAQQQDFLERVVTRRAAKMEATTRPSFLHAAATGLALLGAGALFARGAIDVATASLVAGSWHAALAYVRERSRKRRALPEGPSDLSACFRDKGGVLRLRLDEGERVILEHDADGLERATLRKVGGGVNALWGILLSGLPAAVFAPLGGILGTVLTAVGIFAGTALFGRGAAMLVATRAAERVVVTDRRVAVLVDEGVAHSILLQHLRQRPVVVGRGEGRASLALAARPLPASRPLPAQGLYGVFDLDEVEAKRVAGELMEARRLLLAAPEM